MLTNPGVEGHYGGGILQWGNSSGKASAHVDEQYIDFSDITKDQKDRFPVSSLTYYKTDFGADAFEDEDREMRILFYDHYTLGDKDFGTVMKIQIYVGEDVHLNYQIGETWFSEIGSAPDGWAADMRSFVRAD